jgi:uncharacterized protein (DUF924 family)
MSRIDDILNFWLDDTPEKQWYQSADGLDDRIRALFAADWGRAVAGQLAGWCDTPRGTLAFLILTDQFPRNMFRGSHLAFAGDPLALAAARIATHAKTDLAIDPPQRQFFYMPFMHSELPQDQDTCITLFDERLPDPDHRMHARAHRRIIADFGRFPYRNAAFGRTNTQAEQAFMDAGSYPAFFRAFKESHAVTA